MSDCIVIEVYAARASASKPLSSRAAILVFFVRLGIERIEQHRHTHRGSILAKTAARSLEELTAHLLITAFRQHDLR